MSACDQAINEVICVFLGGDATLRQQYMLRELLRNLVRMARNEMKAELTSAVLMLQDDRLVDPVSQERSKRATKKLMADLTSKQTKLNFGR